MVGAQRRVGAPVGKVGKEEDVRNGLGMVIPEVTVLNLGQRGSHVEYYWLNSEVCKGLVRRCGI